MIRFVLVLSACSGPSSSSGDDDDTIPTDPYADIVPSFAFTDEDFEGERLTTFVPDQPRGVLFALHGTNGGFDTITQIEWIELYNLLAEQDVAIVLTQSRDRVARQWALSPDDASNPDFQWLSHVRDHLIDTTALAADTPVLVVGFSNGAQFATIFASIAPAEGWDLRAYGAHQGQQYVPSPVPALFVSAEHDETGATGEAYAAAARQCEERSGAACPAVVGTEIPLEPLWFARMPQYDEEQSQRMFDELVEMEIVEPDGTRNIDLLDMEAVFDQYLAETKAPNPTWVPTQLRVVWATHRFSSQHVEQEANFLLGEL